MRVRADRLTQHVCMWFAILSPPIYMLRCFVRSCVRVQFVLFLYLLLLLLWSLVCLQSGTHTHECSRHIHTHARTHLHDSAKANLNGNRQRKNRNRLEPTKMPIGNTHIHGGTHKETDGRTGMYGMPCRSDSLPVRRNYVCVRVCYGQNDGNLSVDESAM